MSNELNANKIKEVLLKEARQGGTGTWVVIKDTNKIWYDGDLTGIYHTSASYISIKSGGGILAIVRASEILDLSTIQTQFDWYWCDSVEITLNEFIQRILEFWQE